MPHIHHSQFRRYGIVVLIVAFVLVLMLMLDPWLGMSKSPFLLFFGAVMFSTWYGGFKFGLLATFLSAFLSYYFFIPPAFQLTPTLPDIVRLVLFVLQGLLISILCESLRTAKQLSEVNLQKLQVSEERFRLAFNSSDIVIFQQDRDLRYQWIHNPQGPASVEEILGKSDDELFSTSIAEQLTKIKQKVLETGIATRQEVSVTLGEEVRYYDLLVEPLKIGEDVIQGLSCVAVNLTERKQAELEKARLNRELQEAIGHQNEYLALLNTWLTSSPVALAFLDTEYRYVYANEALAAINGIPQSQHIGRTLGEVLPKWVNQLEPIFQKLMETKEPLLNQEVSGETYPLGVYRHSLVSYYPVCLPDGQVLGVGITAIDITQQKETEQALRESEARFRSVVESNMIGIGFWEKDGRITDANDALLNMVGYSREELVNGELRWQDLTPIEYQSLDEQAIAQFQDRSFCTPYEKEYIRKDGSRFPIMAGGSHFEGSIERGAFFILDITERKQAEETLRYVAQISGTLSNLLNYEEVLQEISNISVPQLADWCCVDILNEDGSIRRLPVAHADASKSELARLIQQYIPDVQGKSTIAKVLRTAQVEVITDISDELLVAAIPNDEYLKLLQQVGLKSAIIAPLVAHQQVLGTISFATAESNRRYKQSDLALAMDIAHRCALAVESTRLYRDIQQALQYYAESLSLLDSLLAAAPIGICFLDREFRFIRINQVLADINGLTVEEHLGRKFREVLPKTPVEFESQLQRVLQTKEPLLNLEISGHAPGKPEVYGYWLVNYYPVYNALDETVGIGIILADVTATKQAEKALRESEERFRAMFNQAAVGITLVSLDGQFLQINPALCEITGYSHDELMQMNFQDITHPEDLEVDWENAARVLAREISGYTLEKRYLCKDGSIVWVNLTASVVWDEEGNPKYAVGIIEDISQRKQAQAAQKFLVEVSTLLVASLDYEVALKNVANLAVPTLADWCIISIIMPDLSMKQIAIATANPTKRQILDEIQERYSTIRDTQHPFRKTLLQGKSVFYAQLPNSVVEEIAQDEGHLQLLQSLGMRSLMVIPLYSRGQIFGLISFVISESDRRYQQTDLAIAEDIARRAATAIDNARLYQETQQAKQAAELAAKRTALLQRVTAAFSEALTPQEVANVVVNQGIKALGATGGSIVLVDKTGTNLEIVQAIGYPQSVIDSWASFPITAVNQMAETVRTKQAIFINSLEALIAKYPDLADSVAATPNNSWASIPLIAEGKMLGVLGLSFVNIQEFDQEERGLMLTLGQQCGQAIARAQLYETEQIAREQAETANRIKDEFLAVLSHELRTPLNPILGWAKLLRTRKYDEATTMRALETIERNAKLQTQLIEDLLDVSRILRGKLNLNIHAVDLNATIAAALETVRLAAEAKSIQIQIFTKDIGQVMGDGDRLQQVFWNLLSNAVKFTPPEGRIEVHLDQVGFDAQIRIIDTGKGITPEFLPYVFEYFRQADGKTTRVYGGLGLGLAIVHHLVELHGGTVVAESPGEEQGATFTVKLPLIKNADSLVSNAESVETKSGNENSPLAGVRVLLVDDQPDVREFFSFALEQYGATVTVVASASEALEVLKQSQQDILLSDIGMPVMDGYMLLREIRTWGKAGQIPAIALSAYAGEVDKNLALAAGFQKHFAKPADPDQLVKAIASLIKGDSIEFS